MTTVGDYRRATRLLPRPSPLQLLGYGLFTADWNVLGTSDAQAATDRGVSGSERTTAPGSPEVSHQNSSHKPPSGASPATKRTAGGADASVDAGLIGGDEAGDEGIEPSISWPGRVTGVRTKVGSAHIGPEREDAVGRNVSNVHTPQYECRDVKKDKPFNLQGEDGMLARVWGNPRGSEGCVGRVVQGANTAFGDSVPSTRVMSGSSLPSITARSETAAPYSLPPVSSFPPPPLTRVESGSKGSSESPTKTTPAPKSIPRQSIASEHGPDVTPGDVSPLTVTATAGTDVAPTGRQTNEIHRTNRPGASPG